MKASGDSWTKFFVLAMQPNWSPCRIGRRRQGVDGERALSANDTEGSGADHHVSDGDGFRRHGNDGLLYRGGSEGVLFAESPICV